MKSDEEEEEEGIAQQQSREERGHGHTCTDVLYQRMPHSVSPPLADSRE